MTPPTKYSYTRFSSAEYESKKDALGFKGTGARSKDGDWVMAQNGSEDAVVDCDQSPEIPTWIPDTYPVRVQVDGYWTTEQQPLKIHDPHYTNAQANFIINLPQWRPDEAV